MQTAAELFPEKHFSYIFNLRKREEYLDGRKLATAELKDQEIENKKKSYVVGFLIFMASRE